MSIKCMNEWVDEWMSELKWELSEQLSLQLLLLLLLSCFSRVRLCDPIDGSPPGSPVPGILQAKTLEWIAISFSNAWTWKVKVKSLSHVRLFATPTRLLCPWDFPGKSTGVRCHCLLRSLQRCFSNLSLHRNHLENCWTTDHWDLCPRRGRGAENLHF